LANDFIGVIEPAVRQMRALDGNESRREFIEYLILLLCDIDPYFVTHYIFGIAKCTTIRLGISLEGFTHKNDHADTRECLSWRAGHSISEALPDTYCDLWNGGMNLSWVSARVICKNDGCGHCDVWTKVEAYLAAQPLVNFCYVCAQLDIHFFLTNFGGAAAASIFFDISLAGLTGYIKYESFQKEISSLIFIEPFQVLTFMTSIYEDIKFGPKSKIRSIIWTSLFGVSLQQFSGCSLSLHSRVQGEELHLLLLLTLLCIFGVTIKVHYLFSVHRTRTIGSMN
jgi:hypothetical protein